MTAADHLAQAAEHLAEAEILLNAQIPGRIRAEKALPDGTPSFVGILSRLGAAISGVRDVRGYLGRDEVNG